MISLNELDLARFTPFFPFAMMVLAIIFMMLATIFRLSVKLSFWVSILFLTAASASRFGKVLHENSYGFYVDGMAELGIQILVAAVMSILIMILQKDASYSRKMESMTLVLLSSLGAMVTLASFNWMLLFIGLQCMSLPIYGLLAFDPNISISSSVRYLLLSFVAMGILLFGILLLYAATGSMDLAVQSSKIREVLPSGIASLGIMLTFIGIAFKVSLFPFHFWAPEVYSGARFFVISYLLIVVKSVVLIFLMRMAFFLFADPVFTSAVGLMAILSMWVGNGMMLRQTSFIRLLAYLSIGHLGALMIPILAYNNLGIEAIFLDIIAFGLAVLLIFSSLKGFNEDGTQNITLLDLKGLYYRRPVATIALTIALISLTGFPLTAGFIGKLAIFQSAMASSLWYLIINFVLSSILGLLVMAKIVASFWQPAPENATVSKLAFSELMLCATLVLLAMGIFPEPWIAMVKTYTSSF